MKRKLRPDEENFLRMMLKGQQKEAYFLSQLPYVIVEEMNDGGMGSLRFITKHHDRYFGYELTSVEFSDEDGVPVIATLNIDNYGDIFELDIWKTDFSSLKKLGIGGLKNQVQQGSLKNQVQRSKKVKSRAVE